MNVAESIVATAAPEPVEKAQATEGAPAEAPKEEAMSPKLAHIARKERDLVQKQLDFKKQQEDFAKEREQLRRELEEERAKRAIWKEDPDKALEELGWDYDRLTERKLNGGGLTPKDLEKRYEERFKSLEQRIEEEKKQAQELQAKKEQEEAERVVNEFRTGLKDFVSKNSDKYRLSNLFDKNAELLYDTIDTYYQQHGKILANDEAAALVEKYFVKMYEDAKKALTPAEQAALDAERKELGVSDRKPSSTTLTNSMAPSGTAGFVSAKTDSDRMKRAMAALDGNR